MIRVIKSVDELQFLQNLLSEKQSLPFDMKQIDDEDSELNMLSNYSSFLGGNIASIVARSQYSYLDILYSWYYWFTKFLVFYESTYGRDEGIRQAQFKIMERIDDEASVDCDVLESIEKELGYRE